LRKTYNSGETNNVKVITMGNTCVPCHIHLHRFAVQLPTLFCVTTTEVFHFEMRVTTYHPTSVAFHRTWILQEFVFQLSNTA